MITNTSTIKKHDWRKDEKGLYLPGEQPELIAIPTYQYITIQGRANPNSERLVDVYFAPKRPLYRLKQASLTVKQGHIYAQVGQPPIQSRGAVLRLLY